MTKPLFQKHPWLRIEHIVAAKLGLSIVLVAAYVVPAPWNVPVGIAANMVWVWKF